MLRVNGALVAGAGPALDAGRRPQPGAAAARTGADWRNCRRSKSVDLSFMREGMGRFRVNIHHQRGTLAASIRLLPSRIPSLESLHLPASLAKLAERRQGLVLVTGPTGCGKTSTLAALIDIVNTRRAAHVVTIEDPVEYQHANRSSIIEQIEVGRDTPDFAVTLRSIMRQTPGRDPGGRNARRRDHGDRADRGRDRPPGAFDAAHQRRHPGGGRGFSIRSRRPTSRRSGSRCRWRWRR